MLPRIDNRRANFRAKFHDRLMHLRFDLLFQHDLAALEDFLNVRAQLARLRIDNREFLFDTESKRVLFHERRKKNIRRFRRFTQIISGSPKLLLPSTRENLRNLWKILHEVAERTPCHGGLKESTPA